jgi:hypothetical protein
LDRFDLQASSFLDEEERAQAERFPNERLQHEDYSRMRTFQVPAALAALRAAGADPDPEVRMVAPWVLR